LDGFLRKKIWGFFFSTQLMEIFWSIDLKKKMEVSFFFRKSFNEM